MKTDDLKELYVAELQEARSFETQVAEAMDGLVETVRDPALKAFLENHMRATSSHAEIVTALIEGRGATPAAHVDQAMQAIVSETRKWCDAIADATVRDAALIASAQRIAHYQIAVYGTLVAWAQHLGADDAESLRPILEAEKRADAKLTELAQGAVNLHAAA